MKMIKIILIMWLLLQPIACLYTQEKPKIKSDSLLRMFKTMEAFDVLSKVYVRDIDVKDCYYNEELKPYVLKWLDKEAYFEYLHKERVGRWRENKNFCINEVKGWLTQHNKSHLIDTVLKDSSLFNVYLDSAIFERKKFYRKILLEEGGHILPKEALDFHALLKLPESYEILHRYWKEDGGKMSSMYFYTMLAMHDPEAIGMYNNYADSVIKGTDLIAIDDVDEKSSYIYLYGSYSMELKLKLLLVTVKKIHSFSYIDEGILYSPYNIDYLNPLSDVYFQYCKNEVVLNILNKIYNPMNKIKELKYEELEKYGYEIVKNIEEFKKALQPYIDRLKNEELYWKKNMPYYKGKNVN